MADFGDLVAAKLNYDGGSNSIRGLGMGGETPSYSLTIDYVAIATTGDAADFGDLSAARSNGAVISTGHGGLGF